MSDGRGHVLADLSGLGWTNRGAFPAVGTEGFGYTVGWYGAGNWTRFATTDQDSFMSDTGPTAYTDQCIAYKAQASPTTPAGAYSTTVIYTAVPGF